MMSIECAVYVDCLKGCETYKSSEVEDEKYCQVNNKGWFKPISENLEKDFRSWVVNSSCHDTGLV